MLSRVILRSFGTVNSTLYTDAPSATLVQHDWFLDAVFERNMMYPAIETAFSFFFTAVLLC